MQTTLELAWLGGIIDGEGCIGVIRHAQTRNGRRYQTWRPAISIVNTNPLIIERAARILERAEVPFQVHVHPLKHPNWKQRTDIIIVGLRRAERAIEVLRPYVYGKAAQLELMDRLIQSRRTTLAMPRTPRPGGGSEMPGFTDAELQVVADLQSLNACGRMIHG